RVGIRAGTVAGENFKVDQINARRNTHNRASEERTVAADESGNVRAVAIAIIRVSVRNKTLAVNYARSASHGIVQVGMIGNAAVCQRYREAANIAAGENSNGADVHATEQLIDSCEPSCRSLMCD